MNALTTRATIITKAAGIKIRPFAQNLGTPKSLSFENCALRHRQPQILSNLVDKIEKRLKYFYLVFL